MIRNGLRALKNIKTMRLLDQSSADEVIRNVDNFMFDCDGVLYHGNVAIPGCSEALQKLKKLGKRIYYITNNSSKTRKQVVEKCKDMGFPAEEENIMCTAYASALYLKTVGFKGKLYMVGNPSLATELGYEGIDYIGYGADAPPSTDSGFDDVAKFQHEWQPDPEVKGVLVGFDPHHSYRKMIKAATYARNPNNLFVATNEDAFLPIKSDVVIPGTGSIVASVKIPACREPIIVGKPATTMFDLLHKMHELEAEKTMMVGDYLKTDIAMAGNCGLRSLLVLTGVDNLDSVEARRQAGEEKHIPEFYIDSLAHFGEMIKDI